MSRNVIPKQFLYLTSPNANNNFINNNNGNLNNNVDNNNNSKIQVL